MGDFNCNDSEALPLIVGKWDRQPNWWMKQSSTWNHISLAVHDLDTLLKQSILKIPENNHITDTLQTLTYAWKFENSSSKLPPKESVCGKGKCYIYIYIWSYKSRIPKITALNSDPFLKGFVPIDFTSPPRASLMPSATISTSADSANVVPHNFPRCAT